MDSKDPQGLEQLNFDKHKEQPRDEAYAEWIQRSVERRRGPQVAGAIVAWILVAIFLIALILLALDGFHYLYYGSFFAGR